MADRRVIKLWNGHSRTNHTDELVSSLKAKVVYSYRHAKDLTYFKPIWLHVEQGVLVERKVEYIFTNAKRLPSSWQYRTK